ncbi:major facilitator transporter [Tribonema minus]|uniref:Major facilitator transporter n=1 Tax=Tribonema minus TaxID=303371 RepID=A0A835Z4T5_9STRA|nr:major facilitator transporter [Tribonema minus]
MLRSRSTVGSLTKQGSRYLYRKTAPPKSFRGGLGRPIPAAYEFKPLLPGFNVVGLSTDRKEEEANKPGWLSREAAIASPDFTNRWAMVLPAFLTHMCIGTPWAWSVMSSTLSREFGVAGASAADWSITAATMPLSVAFALQGISAALGGSWALRVGPRKAMGLAGLCFGGGLMIGGAGISMHSLPLLYAGYGVLAGTGIGLAYTPPVQALIGWFPDKKGLASGLTIAGFGSGALVFTPMVNNLMAKFAQMPQYLGTADSVDTTVVGGKMLAQVGDAAREVISVTSADIAKLPYDIAEGVYVVGTGTTGAGTALSVCGAVYGAIMLASAFTIKLPRPGFKPAGWEPPVAAESAAVGAVAPAVTANTVLKTPQFHMLGAVFFSVACGGMGLMSVAKPMMSEVFSSSLPNVVTAAFASQYVQLLSAGNLGGRIGWAAFSDKFGRRLTFNMFTLGSIPLYLSIPPLIASVVSTQSPVPLAGFALATTIAITFMGGVYSILPAYEADLFGAKYIGPIHGRMLLYSTMAALIGPAALLKLRLISETQALHSLLAITDPDKFAAYFRAPISAADELITSKTLTIAKLMDIVPPGTPDPSPFVYDTTMYAAAGLMGVAAVAHSMVRPVAAKYFESAEQAQVAEAIVKSPAAAVMLPSMASHRLPLLKRK